MRLKRRIDEWRRREMERVRWAQSTPEGRRENRRVTFHHIYRSGVFRLITVCVVIAAVCVGLPGWLAFGLGMAAGVAWLVRDSRTNPSKRRGKSGHTPG